MVSATVIDDSDQAGQRLAELGLDEGDLARAGGEGLFATHRCTRNHPANFRGLSLWAETTRAARDQLGTKGWESKNENGAALVVSPNGETVITVATGDEGTGRSWCNPQTKSSKGTSTVRIVRDNVVQLELFSDTPASEKPLFTTRAGWILLVHRDDVDKELRMELSRPTGMGSDDRVNGWSERILLQSIPFDGEAIITPKPDLPSGPDINVELKRRG